MFDRFSDFAIEVILGAAEECRVLRVTCIDNAVLLLGFIRTRGVLPGLALGRAGIDNIKARSFVQRKPDFHVTLKPDQHSFDLENMTFSADFRQTLEVAWELAEKDNSKITSEILFLALMRVSPTVVSDLVSFFDISIDEVKTRLNDLKEIGIREE